jgi:tRNA threonylcarbamoyladenosine biosynthesis protein TsaE
MPCQKHITLSEKETIFLAKNMAYKFNGREVILLTGDLGAGKTVFAKGIALGLGLKNIHQVCSPSYTILNIYNAKFDIYHFDFYRISKEETNQLGWEDYIGCGVIVVEWAEKINYEGKAFRVKIKIGKEEDRIIQIDY